MSQHDLLHSMTQQALALNAEAFSVGAYEAAYHFLVAALHAAEAAGNAEAAHHIAELAQAQADRLDREAPLHPMATASAQSRSHRPLFRTAEQQARAVRARLAGAKATARAEQQRKARGNPRTLPSG